MTATANEKCTIEVPFDLRLTIRLHGTREQLHKATEHLRAPYTEWDEGPSHERVQRWLNQEVAPQLLKKVRDLVPDGDLDQEAAWLSELADASSFITDITYIADEAGVVH